jgi:hypothetical protein
MADDWYKPGSRLKVRYYEATDGAKQFGGWFDSMRSDECGFGLHADGSTRCLPTAAATSGYFADNGCSQNLGYRVKAATAAPKYVAVYQPDASRKVFPVGATYTGAMWGGTPGACNQVFASVPASLDAYTTGAEIPGSAFVQASLKTSP